MSLLALSRRGEPLAILARAVRGALVLGGVRDEHVFAYNSRQFAQKRTLYVSRPVVNAEEIIAWAKAQGFATTLPADDMHVTVCYSKTPVDWGQPEASTRVTMNADGKRSVEPLGDAVVLKFSSPELSRRWQELRDLGASWDYDTYHPHVTITYAPSDVDLATVVPYGGPIVLGPERFAEVKESWADDIAEHAQVDFAVVARRLDALEERFATELSMLLELARDRVLETPDTAPDHLPLIKDLQRVVLGGLRRAWQAGSRAARLEVGVRKFAEWDEAKHPRHAPGDERGGEFAPGGATYQDWKQAQEYESRLFGGAYSATRLETRWQRGPKGSFWSKAIPLARERYNALRLKFGLKPVKDWNVRPSHDELVQYVKAPKETKTFAEPSYTPDAAVEWLRQKAFWVADVLSNRLTNEMKRIILNALKTGAALDDTIALIQDAFEPYLLRGTEDEMTGAQLETIVRTNTTEAYNHGRLTEFIKPDVLPFLDGIRYSAILDTRTTPVCRFLDGKIFKPTDPALNELVPPNHFNCRSLLVPIVVDQAINPADLITPAEAAHARSLADQRFLAEWDEAKHPRYPMGHPEGGKFKPKDGEEDSPLTKEARAKMTPEELAEYKRKYDERKKRRQLEGLKNPKVPAKIPGPIAKLGTSPLGDFVRDQVKNHRPTAIQNITAHLASLEASAPRVMGTYHRMVVMDQFFQVQLDHMKFMYSTNSGMIRASAAATLMNYASRDIPPELSRSTKTFVLTGQVSSTELERRKLGRGFSITATGGQGMIVAYKGEAVSERTISHEMGHNLAAYMYGTSRPPQNSPLGRLYSEFRRGGEAPVSKYGETSSVESFAEAMGHYVAHPMTMRYAHPKHYEATELTLAQARSKIAKGI